MIKSRFKRQDNKKVSRRPSRMLSEKLRDYEDVDDIDIEIVDDPEFGDSMIGYEGDDLGFEYDDTEYLSDYEDGSNYIYDTDDVPVVSRGRSVPAYGEDYRDERHPDYGRYNPAHPDEDGHIERKITTDSCDVFTVCLCETSVGDSYYEIFYSGETGNAFRKKNTRGGRVMFRSGDYFCPEDFGKMGFAMNLSHFVLSGSGDTIRITSLKGVLDSDTGKVSNLSFEYEHKYMKKPAGARSAARPVTEYRRSEVFADTAELDTYINDLKSVGGL